MNDDLPVLIPDLPMQDYLDHPGYGSSDLRAYRAGPPAVVPWRRQHRSNTSATTIGSAVACRLLESSTFDDRFVVKPEGMEFRSKENKEQRDAWLAAGLQILSQAENAQVTQICEAFDAKNEATGSLFDALHAEASIFWQCAHSGLLRKGRPDWFDNHAVYDLKVSVNATRDLRGLFIAAQRDGWLDQLAHNRAGLRALGHPVTVGRLVVIAPTPPQGLRTWLLEVSEEDLDVFELQNETAAKGIAACERAKFWPGTPDAWTPFEVLGVINEMTESDAEGAEEADSDNPLI